MAIRKEGLIRTLKPFIIRAALVLLAATGLTLALIKLFTITTIEVVGVGVDIQVDKEKIINNLLFFPTDKLRSDILRDNQLLADVRFEKKFPHTLVIKPVVRLAFARLETADRRVLLDIQGIVVGEGSGMEQLPVLKFPDVTMIRTGQRIGDTRILQGLRFYELVDGLLPIDYIAAHEGSALLAKSGTLDIFFPQDANMAEILATLQTLMTGFRIKGTLPTVVDLRFDKPVVKF